MIEVIKNNSISFLIKMDVQGIEEMLKHIEALKNKNEEYPQILYLGKKRKFEIEINNDMDKMLIYEDVVKVYMDDEEIEYLEQRLNDAIISRYFYPAEICERKYKNRCMTIYCNII